MYSETACGVMPILSAISFCLTSGWCADISTSIWNFVASFLLRNIISFPDEFNPLPFHRQYWGSFCHAANEHNTFIYHPLEPVHRLVAACHFFLYHIKIFSYFTVALEGDRYQVAQIFNSALEVDLHP